MLTEQEMTQIRDMAGWWELKSAAAPEALQMVQRHHGWVSDEALCDIARVLGMTTHELDDVATFYNQIFRSPAGRHVIRLCDSVSCWVMGSESIADYIRTKLGIGFGETTKDGLFTLVPNACLGACDKAPVMMIDEDLHENVTPDGVDRLIAAYANRETPATEGRS